MPDIMIPAQAVLQIHVFTCMSQGWFTIQNAKVQNTKDGQGT